MGANLTKRRSQFEFDPLLDWHGDALPNKVPRTLRAARYNMGTRIVSNTRPCHVPGAVRMVLAVCLIYFSDKEV